MSSFYKLKDGHIKIRDHLDSLLLSYNRNADHDMAFSLYKNLDRRLSQKIDSCSGMLKDATIDKIINHSIGLE